jgi:hypothetical protein
MSLSGIQHRQVQAHRFSVHKSTPARLTRWALANIAEFPSLPWNPLRLKHWPVSPMSCVTCSPTSLHPASRMRRWLGALYPEVMIAFS